MKLIKRKLFTPTIPIINVHGLIDLQRTAQVMTALQRIDLSTAVALAVSVNSRGGHPAQSQIIANRLRYFADTNNIKLYTFAGDNAASGGYAVLCIGDQVYADRISLVGSVGVVWKRYSFAGLLNAIDFTQYSIENQKTIKSAINPFNPFEEADRQILQSICDNSHQNFIELVKQYRKGKLDLSNKNIFSGDAIPGEDALKSGLIDGIGTLTEVLTKKYPNAKIEFPMGRNLRQRLYSFSPL